MNWKKSVLSIVGVVLAIGLVLVLILRTPPSRKDKAVMTIQLTSSAFAEGEFIPAKYSCDGEDVSPPLKWSTLPTGVKGLAPICDDPDAPVGTWVPWCLDGLPPTEPELPEKLPTTEPPAT